MGQVSVTKLYKIRPKVKVPFVKDFLLESVDKKTWLWLIKVLNITYAAENIARLVKDGNKYSYFDNDYPNGKDITEEEYNEIGMKYFLSNNKILKQIYKYNLPIYTYSNNEEIIRNIPTIIVYNGMYAI